MKTLSLAVLVSVGIATAASAADDGFTGAPPAAVGDQEETYGTGSLTVYTIPAANFSGRTNTVTYVAPAGIERTITAGFLEASPMLPNGSQIERIELRACDTSATAEVRVGFGPCPVAGVGCTAAGSAGTGVAATPGCSNFSTTLPVPLIVNNQTTPILLSVSTGTAATTTFSAVKLYYRLRISPAPAVATFPNDVPTSHPFFRFVEALAAAGITGGCGAGAYCPDSAVTRGQMAVFLATALGLHFPN